MSLATENLKSCSQAPVSNKKPSSCDARRVRHQDLEPSRQEANEPFPLAQSVQDTKPWPRVNKEDDFIGSDLPLSHTKDPFP